MRSRALICTAVLTCIIGCTHHAVLVDKGSATLTLHAPGAKNVQFASSLDGYELHQARQNLDADWVILLPSDRQFSYFYVVDGKVFLPECSFTEPDDFGSCNCVYVPGM